MASVYDLLFIFDVRALPDRGLRLDQDILQAARQGLRIGLAPVSMDVAVPTFLREHVSFGRAVLLPLERRVTAERVVVHGADQPAINAALTRVTGASVTFFSYERSEATEPDVGANRDVPPDLVPTKGKGVLDTLPRPAIRGLAWLTAPILAVMQDLQERLGSSTPDILDLSGPLYRRFDWSRGLFDDLGFGGIAAERLTRRLDLLLCYPQSGQWFAHDVLIRSSLAAGTPVMLPPRLKARYGSGPLYQTRGAVAREVASLLSAPSEADTAPRTRASRQKAPGQSRRQRSRRSVIFVAAEGGLGHLTRSLAIARRLRPSIPVVVATAVPAIQAIEALGLHPVYLPPASLTESAAHLWEAWFRHDLERLIECHNAGTVVFDGNHLRPALVQAVGPRHGCRLAWVRRAMWGRSTSQYMPNSRWCDAIIEPGELAAERDHGVTAVRRPETIGVGPIRLLDPADLLPRSEAAAALGLDPAKPAVLVQVSPGQRHDTVAIVDRIVSVLRRVPDLRICLAEGLGAERPLRLWPDATYVSGFPLARFYNAFDFSVASAGYNTFHDVMAFGLPTIFIPSRHPSMDDQAARAKYAQDHAAAFELSATDMAEFEKIVTLIMNERARAYLRNNALRLATDNGAAGAARIIEKLLRADVP